jgi:hypothetical protein
MFSLWKYFVIFVYRCLAITEAQGGVFLDAQQRRLLFFIVCGIEVQRKDAAHFGAHGVRRLRCNLKRASSAAPEQAG